MAITDNEVSSIGRPSPARTTTVPSPLPSVSLSREHITEAFKQSPDGGITLDLAKKNLTDVGEDGASELAGAGQVDTAEESTVVRIALAHNRLTTLPMAFSLLTQLRYLVLKDNNFTIFPDVLTVMPSLEILDISRNKIKRLPSEPGTLTNLRVFSLSRNRIHRLPTYISEFRNLNLLKVDHNPLEWPPKNVVESLPQSEGGDAARAWVRELQRWIQQNSVASDRKSTEGFVQESSFVDMDHDIVADQSRDDSLDDRSPFGDRVFIEGSSTTQHNRTFSLDSEQSNYSENILPAPLVRSARSPKSPRPPRLHLDAVSSHSTHTSPHHSPDSYLPTPDESVSSTDEELSQIAAQLHNRNPSLAASGGTAQRSYLPPKKSMPDLRPAKLQLNSRKDVSLHAVNESSGMPSPPHRQESDSSTGSHNFRTPKFSPSVVASPIALHRPAPHMDGERHKYFRRMSSLNMGTLVKTVPPALLTLVDGIRGILFGVSQIYQALQHYTEYAIDERLSAVLLKVLDPGSMYMNQLINALDRFDTMSRRAIPSPAICRSVVETCRDNVNIFGKAVGVLALQLKVLATHDDARYTRQMLLVLYGAMAEISGAWASIASQIEAVKPFLREHGPPSATKSLPTPSSSLDASTPSTGGTITPTPTLHPPRTNIRSPTNGASDVRARMARRHAGSFSYKDVELGMLLPSNLDSPPLSSGLVGGPASTTPVPRPIRRTQTAGPHGIHDDGTIRPSVSRIDLHSRQSSASSLLASATTSPALPLAKSPSLDVMSSAHTMIDGVAVDAIKYAVESAPPVWHLLEVLLQQDLSLRGVLHDTLRKAQEVTSELQEDIRGMTHDPNRRIALREDAHLFANTVTQLLNTLKTYGMSHNLSSDLRNSMVQLSQATQDFLMLLHVSSFSPTPLQRPYSPMVGVLSPPPPLEDGRLGANLSRSRSAASPAVARTLPAMKEPPRSALPHGTFILSPPR